MRGRAFHQHEIRCMLIDHRRDAVALHCVALDFFPQFNHIVSRRDGKEQEPAVDEHATALGPDSGAREPTRSIPVESFSSGSRRSAFATTQEIDGKRLCRVRGRVSGQVEPDAADRAVRPAIVPSSSPLPDPSSATTGGCCSSRRVTARAATDSRTARPTPASSSDARASTASRESPASSDFRSCGCSRFTYPLRAMSYECPRGQTSEPIDPVERLVAVADRARQGQFERRLPLSASGKWRSCPPCRTRRC